MPETSRFFGIVVAMYHEHHEHHEPPRFGATRDGWVTRIRARLLIAILARGT